jgi:NAD(P)-dependent dehydrogenase (short-subunit alcohol dehydrogenase family)
MAARDSEKNEAAAARVREEVPGADLELRELDLASLASVREFAKGFLADHDEVEVLMNNAGVMACPQDATSDGFELQLGTNHIGHFLLTNLLAPALGAGAPARVVCLSSGAHAIAGIDFEDPMFERRAYDPWLAYGQSKTANALFALELDRRLGEGGSAYSVHPGMIMTALGRHLTPETLAAMSERVTERTAEEDASVGKDSPVGEAPQMTFKPVEAGAATQVWAATSPVLEGHGGAYLGDCQLGVAGGNPSERGFEAHAADAAAAKQLWTASEEWVGQSFDL